jgi:hypothetical protein
MQQSGAGQRWNSVENEVLRKHGFAQNGIQDAPFEQRFDPPGACPTC